MAGEWMDMPQIDFNCPPGLEYLTTIDQLLVHQIVELEFFTEAKNKFIIKNNKAENVYYAFEDFDSENSCYGKDRSFDMHVLDNHRKEVIHVYRPRTDFCCSLNDSSRVEVFAPTGTRIGTVEEEVVWFGTAFSIKNVSGDTILKIKGPSDPKNSWGTIDFEVKSANGSAKVGQISKRWSLRKMFSPDDYFGITFPMDLDVRMKALMIGALFLIDILYFED